MNKTKKNSINRALYYVSALLFILSLLPGLSLEAQTHGNVWNYGPVAADVILRDLVYTGTSFVAVGDSNVIYTSTNGTTWTKRATSYAPNQYAHIFGVAAGGGKVVGVGRDLLIMTSSNDGATWTTTQAMSSDVYQEDIYKVAYGNGTFVATGEFGGTWRSSDGITWTKGSLGSSIRDVAFGNGEFLAATTSGRIYHSVNGAAWTSQFVGNHLVALHYDSYRSQWIVGGTKIWTSSNGSSWTQRLDITNCKVLIHSLTSTPGGCIAAGESGLMLNSADGVTWRNPDSKTVRYLFGMAYANNTAVAVGNGGPFLGSNNPVYLYSTHYSASGGTIPALFTTCGSSAPSIRITAPNGGETLTPGNSYTIKWTSSNVTDPVRLRYSTDGGANYQVIVNSTSNNGSYSWTVPNVNSSNCLVRINAANASGSPNDTSNSVFTIGAGGGAASLTVLAPNGGETLTAGSTYTVKWSSESVGNLIRVRYSTDNGSSWALLADNQSNDGAVSWTVPNVSSSTCLVRVNAINAAGTPYDVSNSVFTIKDNSNPATSITITTPNGGEAFQGGTTNDIIWGSSGAVGNVKIDYSTNSGSSWTEITSNTSNDGHYPWSTPDIQSDTCLIRITEVAGNQVTDNSNAVFSITGPPVLNVDKTSLSFGSVENGVAPTAQEILITNSAGGTLNWSAVKNAAWLTLTPASGNGNGAVSVTVNQTGLNAGEYTDTITVSSSNGDNSPQTVSVLLKVIRSNQDAAPFGQFATPLDGTTARGSVGVTGWVLDDVETANVKIYRIVNGGDSYIGDAVFVEGSRPDVENSYPGYPLNSRSGWGYMLLTNFLPDGSLTLKAVATDVSGKSTTLGTKTITLDNAHADKPFGAIDTPAQGGEISGSNYRNDGWCLTPLPNTIPKDGSTINVYIDGTAEGKAVYNNYREDIATLFPGLNNSNGAWAYFFFNSNNYENGVHTIEWSVKDNAGNSEGVGSRYFSIKNINSRKSAVSALTSRKPKRLLPTGLNRSTLNSRLNTASTDFNASVKLHLGYNDDAPGEIVKSDNNGTLNVSVKELDRVVLDLDADGTLKGKAAFYGFMKVGDQLRDLPIGSTLDSNSGKFYWSLAPAWVGDYTLVFVGSVNGRLSKQEIVFTIQ